MNVFIITRCIDLKLKKSATLVFDSIRIGYPTANITCFYLGDFKEVEAEIQDKCAKLDITFIHDESHMYNYEIIEFLVNQQQDNFVVVDSDMVFWKSLEWYKPVKNLAGRHIPKHWESFVSAITEERLHTSLMYFNDVLELRKKIADSFEQKCSGVFTPYNVFAPVVIKFQGDTIFYDSCTNLYQAIGGEAFGKDVLECYDHLFAGSFYTEVGKDKPDFIPFFDSVFADIKAAKGISRKQRNYWYSNVYKDIEKVFGTISLDAQRFITAYNEYIETIDDLVDTDNKMLVDKITEIAANLFSSNYWIANNSFLWLVEKMVHMMYFNSVVWEKSAVAWKRRDAKSLCHCGYILPLAVLLLETKDLPLVQSISLKLLERSHLAHMEDLTQKEYAA